MYCGDNAEKRLWIGALRRALATLLGVPDSDLGIRALPWRVDCRQNAHSKCSFTIHLLGGIVAETRRKRDYVYKDESVYSGDWRNGMVRIVWRAAYSTIRVPIVAQRYLFYLALWLSAPRQGEAHTALEDLLPGRLGR